MGRWTERLQLSSRQESLNGQEGAPSGSWINMSSFGDSGFASKAPVAAYRDTTPSPTAERGSSRQERGVDHSDATPGRNVPPVQYRVYKRRFFGLLQLVLLNIIVSWDWLTFSAVSTSSAKFFGVSEDAINWLSTGFLFAFVAISPVVLWTLNRGPKPAIVTSAVLILIGNWIRYGGARAKRFGVVMFGQILIGFAQPFVLTAPTRYSDLWFTEKGRISATAVASLANPLGGALGQLIGPAWATDISQIPNLVLYTAAISTVACIPAYFIPAAPPTPPSASSALPKTPLNRTFRTLFQNRAFYCVVIPFSIYTGFFNALSSLINQVMAPYGFSEDQAGIGGGLLIIVGLIASAITSPIVDRTHAYLPTIKTLVPVIGAAYLAFIWAPQTRTVVAPYILLSMLGASSFALVPVALEYLVEVTFPASPEVTSVICWTMGQLLGAVFIIIMAALKQEGDGGHDRPKGNLYNALVFQAVLACLTVPLPLLLGSKRLGLGGENRNRFTHDAHSSERSGEEEQVETR